MLNAFNHFNPGDPNLQLQYNYGTGLITNASFGQITAAATNSNARIMVASLRFRF